MVPSASPYFTALDSRLSTTWRTRRSSTTAARWARRPGSRRRCRGGAPRVARPRPPAAPSRRRRRSALQLEAVLARLADVQQVRQQGLQPQGVAAYDAQLVDHVGGQLLVVAEQLEVAEHRGQRCAQLVGDRGHELVLHLHRPHQLGDLLVGQRRAQPLPWGRRTWRAEVEKAARVRGSSPTQ